MTYFLYSTKQCTHQSKHYNVLKWSHLHISNIPLFFYFAKLLLNVLSSGAGNEFVNCCYSLRVNQNQYRWRICWRCWLMLIFSRKHSPCTMRLGMPQGWIYVSFFLCLLFSHIHILGESYPYKTHVCIGTISLTR